MERIMRNGHTTFSQMLPRHASFAFCFWLVQLIYRITSGTTPVLCDILFPFFLFAPWAIRPLTWRLVISIGCYFVIYYVAFLHLLDGIVVRAHWMEIPNLETRLFAGWSPVVEFQKYRTIPLNVFFCVGYSLHIVNILLPFFYLLFKKEYAHAEEYVSVFLACGYLGFTIYLLYPVVPPRLALPDVTSVSPPWASGAWESAGQLFRANPYAALPSLHCAFPFLSFLYLRARGYSLAWLFAGMSLWLFVGTIYLGEHYFLDVLGGMIVASIAFFALTLRPRFGHTRSLDQCTKGQ